MSAAVNFMMSCGLLLLPAVAWNIALGKHLPPAYQPNEFKRDIPVLLVLPENGFRVVVFMLPFLMPLDMTAPGAVQGLGLFCAGTLVYFASWLALILHPKSGWSRSRWGFAAPAYTPVLWLVGIALLGDHLFWGTFYRWWMYLIPCAAFLMAHITHTMRVYVRMHQHGAV